MPPRRASPVTAGTHTGSDSRTRSVQRADRRHATVRGMTTATTNALTELTFDPTSDAEWEELRALVA